jgi:hypothetical protein
LCDRGLGAGMSILRACMKYIRGAIYLSNVVLPPVASSFQLRNIPNPILFDQVTRISLQHPAVLHCIPASRTIKLEGSDEFSTSHVAHHPRAFRRPQRCLQVGSNHSARSAPATAISQSRQAKVRAVLYLAPLVQVERISDVGGIVRRCSEM